MSFKSILTVITEPDQNTQLDAAIAIARREDAHLEVVCVGVDATQTGYYYAGASAYVFQDAIDRAMAEAAALEQAVRHRLEGQDLRWSAESAVAQVGGFGTLIARHARFCDLMVQGAPGGDAAPARSASVIEAGLFDGHCPVLVIPRKSAPLDAIGKRALIGWNQSDEALRAVRRALPLLRRAEGVEIVVVDPSPHSAEGSDPGGALCRMINRHGVRCEIAVLARTEPAVSDVLNRRAQETGTDMMVLGGYSHSRLRQSIMGGTTRDMLDRAVVPVFMAH